MTREETWARYLQIATVDLGLSREHFWKHSTPRTIKLLLDRKQIVSKHEDQYREFLMGVLASTVANFSMTRGKEAYKPSDFMPSEWNKPKRQQSYEEMSAALQAWGAVTNVRQ